MSSHTAETRLGLIGKLLLEGEMICETGLHIGAGKGSLDLGGADNPVVKDAFGRPYVPGSSLRGKLRSLLEQSAGLVAASDLIYLSRRRGQEVRIHQSDEPGDEIGLLFGRNPGRVERVTGEAVDTTTATPARLTVYDALLEIDSITESMRENLDDELTEVTLCFSMKRLEDEAATESISELNDKVTNLQFSQDVPIWENKIYRERPIITKVDGPVAQYRRWFRQFYSNGNELLES